MPVLPIAECAPSSSELERPRPETPLITSYCRSGCSELAGFGVGSAENLVGVPYRLYLMLQGSGASGGPWQTALPLAVRSFPAAGESARLGRRAQNDR